MDCIQIIAGQPYFKSLIAMMIVIKQDNFLSALLDFSKIGLDDILNNIAGYFSSTYVLLAIWYDNPSGLELLLQYGASLHHPRSGELVLGADSTYYHRKVDEIKSYNSSSEREISESESESDNTSEKSEEGDDLFSIYSEDSENFESLERYESGFEEELEDDEVEAIIDEFISYPHKYWSGFKKESEPQYRENSRGELIRFYSNPRGYELLYIHQAVIYDRLECLDVLLNAYGNRNQNQVINLTNEYGETPLHVGALKNAVSSIQLLLERGSEVDRRDFWGETPLHNAVYESNIKIAAFLLKKGADPNLFNKKRLTPYHIAIVCLDLRMVKLLFNYGGDLSLIPFEEVINTMHVADLLERVDKNFEDTEK